LGDADSDRLTFGVEEEFLLIEPDSGKPAACAPAVLDRARAEGPVGPGAAMHAELLTTQVEAATGICADVAELRAQLAGARSRLAASARAEGARLVSVGTPVLDGPTPPRAPGRHFAEVADAFAGAVADYQVCGCHVHVAIPDRESAIAVINRLRPWLPTLLALSVNSPFDRGRDTGCHSWRMLLQGRFPSSGVPPVFASAADYDERMGALVDCGALTDEHMTFWLARPSNHVPTVEVRVADAALTIDDAALQAALTRAMVHTALREHRRGAPLPRVSETVAAAALWTAARHGMDGPAVDPDEQRRVASTQRMRELLAWVAPALGELGDLETVNVLLSAAALRGTGARRQRRAAASGGIPAVLALLDASTDPPRADRVR
jgi:glutamate---cysteine ligase / carboxylate-amine ligase